MEPLAALKAFNSHDQGNLQGISADRL